jgi:microcystin-dependent protein
VGVYAPLYAVIGTRYGAVDADHFNLPDRRGKFKRGWAHGTGADPDRNSRTAQGVGGVTGDHVGTVQGWQVEAHRHPINTRFEFAGGAAFSYSGTSNAGSNANGYQPYTDYAGGNQTNPINSAVMSVIKAIP